MDGSAFSHINVRPLIYFAIFGWACSMLIGIGGLIFLLYWALQHIRIV